METPLAPSLDQHHQQQEDNKGTVISLSHTVAHPGTVMVEGADTTVTPRAVLRPQRLGLQAGPAELGRQQVLRIPGEQSAQTNSLAWLVLTKPTPTISVFSG